MVLVRDWQDLLKTRLVVSVALENCRGERARRFRIRAYQFSFHDYYHHDCKQRISPNHHSSHLPARLFQATAAKPLIPSAPPSFIILAVP